MEFELFDISKRESSINIKDEKILMYCKTGEQFVKNTSEPGYCCSKQCVYNSADDYYENVYEYHTILYENIYDIGDIVSNIPKEYKYFIINCETDENPFVKQNIIIRMKSSNDINIVHKMILDKIGYSKEIIDKKIEK